MLHSTSSTGWRPISRLQMTSLTVSEPMLLRARSTTAKAHVAMRTR